MSKRESRQGLKSHLSAASVGFDVSGKTRGFKVCAGYRGGFGPSVSSTRPWAGSGLEAGARIDSEVVSRHHWHEAMLL